MKIAFLFSCIFIFSSWSVLGSPSENQEEHLIDRYAQQMEERVDALEEDQAHSGFTNAQQEKRIKYARALIHDIESGKGDDLDEMVVSLDTLMTKAEETNQQESTIRKAE